MRIFYPVFLSAVLLLSLAGCFLNPGPRLQDDGHDHAHDDAYYAELAKNYEPFLVDKSALKIVSTGDRDLYGEWSSVIDWPHIAVSAANLPDGRVLTFASNERTSFPGGKEYTYAAVWDPATGSFLDVPHNSHDMFCAATTMLEDGSIFVNGGRNDSQLTSTFNYKTNRWENADLMNRGRWYPGSVALPSGEVVTAIGRGGSRYPELWSPAGGWRLLTGADLTGAILNRDTGYQHDWLPYLHLMPNGQVFHAGPTDSMNVLNPTGNGRIRPTGLGADWYFKYGTGLMYDEGKVLITGGGDAGGSGAAAHSNALVVDLNGSSPQITTVAPMQFARKFSNGTVLPNGEVLIVGGNTSGIEFNDGGSALTPELWNPDTQTWRSLADMSVPRNYHSVALLLTDGRVLSAGGGLCDCAADHQNAQVFSPPYLYNADGSLATRPLITNAPASASPGQTIKVQASAGMASFSLVKMSATNHHLNSDLRRLTPGVLETSPGNYDVSLSVNANVLTPGYWMLFALNAQGTPSVASIIQIRTTAPKLTHPGNQSSVEGASINLSVNASDPNGDTLSFSASGLPGGLSINETTGQITGLVGAEGSYNVTLTVSDGNETASILFDWLVYTSGNQPGLSYQYFEGDWTENNPPDFDAHLPKEVGMIPTIDLAPRNRLDQFGFRYTGILRVAEAGDYTFYHRADDGGQLWVDGNLVLTSRHPNEASGTINLSKGDHRLTVTYYEVGGGDGLIVRYKGPGFEKRYIPASVLFQAEAPIDSYRYVKLESRSGTDVAVAEFNLLDGSGEALPRAKWHMFADSTEGQNGVANTIDGDGSTLWRSGSGGQPHWLVASLEGEVIGGFRYLPSQSGSGATLRDYRFYGSNDGLTWELLKEGTLSEGSGEKTVLLGAVNQAPSFSAVNDLSHDEDETVSYSLSATDPDGDALSYSVTGLPPGLSLDTQSGLISGTLPFGSAGTYSATATVSDGSLSDEVSFTWTVGVTNRPPSLASPGDQDSANGVSVSLALSASDPDGDALTYSAMGLPPDLELDSATGVMSGVLQTPGNYTVNVSVSDGRGGSDALSFSWQVSDVPALSLGDLSSLPKKQGSVVTYSAPVDGGVKPRVKWLFGDGSPETDPTESLETSHSFSEPGRYVVTVIAQDDRGDEVSAQFVQLVHAPLTAAQPNTSMSILYEPGGQGRVWNANPDNDTVSIINGSTLAKLAEIGVAAGPYALAQALDGRVWVTAKHAARISIIDPNSLSVVQTVNLPYASQPHGIVFAPGGASAYVALEALGQVLRLDASSGAQLGSVDVGSNVRHLSINADGSKLYASRYISPPVPGEATANPQAVQGGGEVVVVNVPSMSVANTVKLHHSDEPDGEAAGRGLPNYLGPAVVSPDGLWAWVPSKQDNLLRGTLRGGRDLSFEHTVRSISSKLDLGANQEVYSARVDHDNAGVASSAVFDPYGNYLFVALEGSREVAVIEAFSNAELLRFDTGRAPQGLTIAPDGRRLYVHNFMDRSVSAFDIYELVNMGASVITNAGTTKVVAAEILSSQVLLGKQHFYDAKDTRLAKDAYISCAACHNDGAHDGRVWDFTGMGEGLRTTTSLEGRAGAHGRLHWSANFDEIQDFEGQIRDLSGGTGLMSNADFNATQDPLGPSKAGRSSDLDALAAYVMSLSDFQSSPHRNSDGSLSAAGVLGKGVFESEACATCHSGEAFSDSEQGTLHDIGTLKPSSGGRLGEMLTGIDTPTLRGVWNSAPYLHDGSAATLADAVLAHSGVGLSGSELDNLVSYLREIDANESAPTPPVTNTAPTLNTPNDQSHTEGDTVALQLSASDPDDDPLNYSASGLPAGLSLEPTSGLISGTLAADAAGSYTVDISVSDGNGGVASTQFSWTVSAPSVNQPPVLTSLGDQLNRVGDNVNLQLVASDPNGDSLIFSGIGLPGGLTLEVANGVISGVPDAAGSYSVSMSVSDGKLTSSHTFTWTIDPLSTNTTTLEVAVSSGPDDAEERSSGQIYQNSTDLELTQDSDQQVVGLRFTGVAIPQGATISKAYVQFQADETASGATELMLTAQAVDDAPAFSYNYQDISGRARTGAAVSWSPAPWTSVGERGAAQRSPNLSALVQELVNRPGWRSGNALVLVITGTGKRVAESFNGDAAAAPRLHLEFEGGADPANRPPRLSGLSDQINTEGDAVSLSLNATDPDGDSLSYSATGLPSDLSLNAQTGTLSGTLASGSVGEYPVSITVSDPEGASDSISFTWLVRTPITGGTAVWFTSSIVAPEDDAEEYLDSGAMRLSSTDLELGVEKSPQAVGIRYRNVTIPQGATITSARLTFAVDEDSPGAAALSIRGEASDTAAVYESTTGNIASRPLTGSSVSWTNLSDWRVDETHTSPDLSDLVQEIVNRPGWQSGSALAFVITGSGTKTAESYNGERGSAPQLAIEYISETPPSSLDVRISSGADDAEERSDGTLYRNSSDLELTTDQTVQTIGLRFNNLSIPQGATVTNAYLQFKVDEATSNPTQLSLQAHAADDAAPFEYLSDNLSARPRTGSQVSWSPSAWTVVGAQGSEQQSPDIAALIQEVVNRPGWRSGNSLVILITGTGERVAESFNGDPAGAPLLHVDFE